VKLLPKSKRNRILLLLAVVLSAIIIASIGKGIHSLTRTRTQSVETPAPSDLSEESKYDPNDSEHPTYLEAKQYLHIVVAKRPLSNPEFDRLLLLIAYTKYSTTPILAMASAAEALELMGDPTSARGKLLEAIKPNLKSKDTLVRQVAIATLGNLKASEDVNLILPFLKSPVAGERFGSKIALTKLGYQFPPDHKPSDE